tara:strand:+ start:463 stop:1743 length:1281 start_codon:yes stop_codon:yes gene_type:complete
MKYYIKFTDIKDYGLDKIYNLNATEHFELCGGENDDSDSPIDFVNLHNIDDDDDDGDDVDEVKKMCKDYPKLPHILPAVKTIICIGDLHGDYKLTLKCLKLANIIDNSNPPKWIAKPGTVVVQIGDQIDRCRPTSGKTCEDPETTPTDEPSDIKILELFTELHNQAIKNGGAVFSLLGNHEIMNVQGNMNYVSYKGIKQFEKEIDPVSNKRFSSGIVARKHLFKKGNKYARFLACTRQTAIIIGSNLFVHASILPDLAKAFPNIKDLNILVKKWLLNLIDDKDSLGSDLEKKGINNIGDILVNYNLSPFWPRVLGNLSPNKPFTSDECMEFLDKTLEIYVVNNMIVGHTPQIFTSERSGINPTCIEVDDIKKNSDGKVWNNIKKSVWRVDVGSSAGFNNFKNKHTKSLSKAQVLKITDDKNFEVLS